LQGVAETIFAKLNSSYHLLWRKWWTNFGTTIYVGCCSSGSSGYNIGLDGQPH